MVKTLSIIAPALCHQVLKPVNSFSFPPCSLSRRQGKHVVDTFERNRDTSLLSGQGKYYGESGGSFVVKEFSAYEQLEEVVKLASQPLPERPDGVVTVVKFTSSTRQDCIDTEGQYERLARQNPATVFLRCFEEYQNADLLMGRAKVLSLPTYDIFYGGNRVGRVEGPMLTKVEDMIQQYQFQNSNLDLFSEEANNSRRLDWGDGKAADPTKVPRTTAAFIPGYDWGSDKGFFDELGDKAQEEWDKLYGEWVPNIED